MAGHGIFQPANGYFFDPHDPVFAIVDTKTSGMGKTARIVELGVVILNAEFNELSRWSTLINPEKTIPNAKIYGITDNMVAGAPTFREVCGELFDVLRGKIVLAHNAQFDADMLVNECDRLTDVDTTVFFPFVGTIDLAKQLTKGPYRLEALATKCGVHKPNAHAAVNDAATTAAVMCRLMGLNVHQTSRELQEGAPRLEKPDTSDWDLGSALPMPR